MFSAENSNEADLASFTPAFLWLLRDFYLSLEEEGRAVCLLFATVVARPLKLNDFTVSAGR